LEELSTECPAVRKLIIRLPTPGGDHGQDELSTFAEQRLIDTRVVIADRRGNVREVELDRPAAARLEVDEQGSDPGAEEVAGMGLAVKRLFVRSAPADQSAHPTKTIEEHRPVPVSELGREPPIHEQSRRVLNPIREVRCRKVEPAHTPVQPLECVGIGGRCDLPLGRREIRPQADLETVALVDTRLDSTVESHHRAVGLGEPYGKGDFERGVSLPDRCDPGHDIAGHEPYHEVVRVLQNGGVISRQAGYPGDGHGSVDCSDEFGGPHPTMIADAQFG
jgi:hypothetical protein